MQFCGPWNTRDFLYLPDIGLFNTQSSLVSLIILFLSFVVALLAKVVKTSKLDLLSALIAILNIRFFPFRSSPRITYCV